MKKLNEIGTEVWPYLDTTQKPKCYMLDEPAADGHTVEFLLSIDERRELVRAIIEAWNKVLFGDRNATIPSIDEFIKEQGL